MRTVVQQPWAKKRSVAAALANADVGIGERPLAGGGKLRGIYAARAFAVREPVASFHGRVITQAELAAIHDADRAYFDRVCDYALDVPPSSHLYPEDIDAVGAHLINHSCGPNADWAETERGARLVRAAKPIAAGEEVTIHYGWLGIKDAIEGTRHPCACTSRYCVGRIELGVEWVREEDGEGPMLPPREVVRRLLADIANGTGANEAMLLDYPVNAMRMIVGVQEVVRQTDPSDFVGKLRWAAGVAVRAAVAADASLRGSRRLREIAQRYEIEVPS